LTEEQLFKKIVQVCAWMNGSVQYELAKEYPIEEIFDLLIEANTINTEIKNATATGAEK